MFVPDSIHLVDPELRGLLAQRPSIAITAELLPLVRQAFAIPYSVTPEALEGVEMTWRFVPGWQGDPDVGLAIYRPKGVAGPMPCILHVHGGGYIAGDAWVFEPVHRALALELGCAIVSVDYRLSPEAPDLGAVHDAYAALTWLWSEAGTLGVDRQRIGVSGESAGGGLAAGLALLVRDLGEYHLLFQHLIYPMLDDRTSDHPDQNPFSGEFIWTRESNHFAWTCLLGGEPGGVDVSPYAAPARAADLAGLPPTFIAVGALDLFVDENLEYARRLIRAGVPTELHVYPGAYHGFSFEPNATVTKVSARDSTAALARALAKPAP